MGIDDNGEYVNKIELVVNKNIILAVLIVVGGSIILSGCLSYIFSYSLFTIICSMVIGTTFGVMINYFIISTREIFKKVNIKISKEEDKRESQTIMINE